MPAPGVSTCIGKFTHLGTFRLTVQALDLLAAHTRHKVWLKPTSEMSFLYGNSILKSGLARITNGVKSGDDVVFFSMTDVPLRVGVAARSMQDSRKAHANAIVIHHQADAGSISAMGQKYD